MKDLEAKIRAGKLSEKENEEIRGSYFISPHNPLKCQKNPFFVKGSIDSELGGRKSSDSEKGIYTYNEFIERGITYAL